MEINNFNNLSNLSNFLTCMLQSQLFTRTKRQIPKETEFISHQLLLRGDFIDQLTSGVFSFLPLGFRVLENIEKIVREEIVTIGGQEIFMPTLQPKSLWQETGRWETIDPPLFKLKDRHQKELALGSTHEEVIFDLVRRRVNSYRDLPLAIFQIQNKFRNEMRSQGGLLRTREFMMKDLYSFHADVKDLNDYYQKVAQAYKKIYRRCGLEAIQIEASGGTIGGDTTHEFTVLADCGEDKVCLCEKGDFAANFEIGKDLKKCPKCGEKISIKNGIEVGHIFQLGTVYSEKMKAEFIDNQGKKQPILTGCYGIGLGRVMATIVEINHDDAGMVWPEEVSPFRVHLLCLQPKDEKIRTQAEEIYNSLQKKGIEVLYDDRQNGPGEKLKDADLLGIPHRIVVSERNDKARVVEYKRRSEKDSRMIKFDEITKLF